MDPTMPTTTESEVARSTRRSIAKNFPLGKIMASGSDNPITLHSVDDQLFVRIWSLIAELMCVTVELSRTTKEAIATMVSERNTCPVCITAHTMMSVVSITVDTSKQKQKNTRTTAEDERKAKQHEQALQYADMLLEEMKGKACGGSATDAILAGGSGHGSSSGHFSVGSGGSSSFSGSGGSIGSGSGKKKSRRKGRKLSHLSSTAKAEVALVIMLFDHMNRVVSVIMGEEMSTAMFSVPRAMARAMEKPGTIKLMSRLMSPLLSGSFKTKHSPGMTLSLFPDEQNSRKALPPQLQGVLLAGLERANAVGRLVDWVECFEHNKLIADDIMNEDLIAFLDRETQISHSTNSNNNLRSPDKVLKWVENCVRDEISSEMEELELEEAGEAIAMVLLLATFAPQTAYQSTHWDTLVDQVGTDMARSIVAWWSLRLTFRQAKGLDTKIDANTMIQILSGGLVPQ